MDFVYEKNSPLPAHTQIKEQIKVALLLGHLRPGEMLPSIRDLEKDLDISRNIVRKAYLELEELGILTLIRGKGVMVNRDLNYQQDTEFLKSCREILERTRQDCRQAGLVVSSFAKYLYQKAIEVEQESAPFLYIDMTERLAKERARSLSEVLHVNVRGASTEELERMGPGLPPHLKLVCNYYRLDEVNRILAGARQAVPLAMRLSQLTRQELNQLPRESRVVFVFDQRDQSRLGLILEDYRKTFAGRSLRFAAYSSKDLDLALAEPSTAKILISNRLWAGMPRSVRENAKVTCPIMEFEPSSIEESRTRLGIIA